MSRHFSWKISVGREIEGFRVSHGVERLHRRIVFSLESTLVTRGARRDAF